MALRNCVPLWPARRCVTVVGLTARGESLAAFDGRCIPAGYVAPPSNTPGILSRRALPSGRLARLGATPDFHHGLLSIFVFSWLRFIPDGHVGQPLRFLRVMTVAEPLEGSAVDREFLPHLERDV